MSLTLKNILINVVYYAVTLVLLPALVLQLESRVGVARHESAIFRAATAVVGIAGTCLQLWCIVLFQRVGGGTPSPAFAPIKLVRSGPYRWLRNPINLGEVMVFLALAGWFGSIALLAYALLAWLAFHVFIVWWEEPRHSEMFGEEYGRYKTAVNRWLPRLGRPRSS